MELSYFEDAVDYLIDLHPLVKSDKGIGVCAISKGGEIALCMASAFPSHKIGAVAVMCSLVSVGMVPMYYHGKLYCDGKKNVIAAKRLFKKKMFQLMKYLRQKRVSNKLVTIC